MRVFIALNSPQFECEALDQACALWGQGRSHDPADRHLTLLFLGEQTQEQCQAIEQTVTAVLANMPKGVVWQGQYIGAFPPNDGRHWAWQGPSNGALDRLRGELALGLNAPIEPWLPHVTLAYGPIEGDHHVPLNSEVRFHQLVLYRSLTQSERQQTAETMWANVRYVSIRGWEI